jgi:hypothetical protein
MLSKIQYLPDSGVLTDVETRLREHDAQLPNNSNILHIAGAEAVTGPKRTTESAWTVGTITLDNSNDFKVTPNGTITLSFVSQPALPVIQKGMILLVNPAGHTVLATAICKVSATFLSTISSPGTYLISYRTNGTDVYLTTSSALA